MKTTLALLSAVLALAAPSLAQVSKDTELKVQRRTLDRVPFPAPPLHRYGPLAVIDNSRDLKREARASWVKAEVQSSLGVRG